jgi:hypothetical protein
MDGGNRNICSVWFENLKNRDYLEYIGINGSIIFIWTIRKYCGRA